MKRNIRNTLFIVSIAAVLGFGCQLTGSAAAPTSNPTLPPVPTKENPPTAKPTEQPTNKPPTAVPTAEKRLYFTEEFESERFLDEWGYFLTGPGFENDQNLVVKQEGDGVTIDLGALNLYFYYTYELNTYDNVRTTMVAENLGRNNNNVSLVCRLDFDNSRWYEFSVESGGLWYLYAYDSGYNFLDSGGTAALKQGKAINEYGLECDGNEISMYINGGKLKTYTDRTYNFPKGQVGFNISSLNVLPITVSVKSFDIAQP